MKSPAHFLLLICLLPVCLACAPVADPEDLPEAALPLEVAVLRGPTGIGAVWLMELAALGQSPCNFHLADNPEQVVALLANGTVQMAALPTNLAANLYAKTEGRVRMTAIITRGMLYVLQAVENLQTWRDLRGRTIYATGRGANPEYILYHLLQAYGLNPGLDVQVEFKSDHAELAALLAVGQVELAMLPEPFVTSALMQNDDLSLLFDLSAEWEALGTGNLAMTALVCQADFLTTQPQTVAAFLNDMERSVNYALENVEEAAALCEKHGIIPKAAVAKQAIHRCNLTFITGAEMKEAVTPYYEVLYAADPQSIGGAMPGEDFYYDRR
jgi:NitT/TauT family transport system substrate-binding protein